jgi:hypothetical protein
VGDLHDPRLIIAKGFLFLLAGAMAVAGLVIEHPDARTAFLLLVAILCCCRFYYFAFYVIEKYVDPEFRFAGLWSAAAYLLRRWRRAPDDTP